MRIKNSDAFILYSIFFLALVWPYWIGGNVISPHRQLAELSLPDTSEAHLIENQKFSDFTNVYIPRISEQLTGSRSGWLTLWVSKTELGRPAYQICDFSLAYLPSWLISRATKNPWQCITILALGTCFLAGLFILLFAREAGLSPISGLIAAVSFSASPLFMYWLTFPMFPSVWCWSAGALWSITRLGKFNDLLGWSILAFCVYSLLMTAYPQPVVFHSYLLGGYGLWIAWRKAQICHISLFKFLTLAISAVLVGAALVFPVYRDLAIVFSESARGSPDPSFFLASLPKFADFSELIRFFVLSTVPELFGNPVAPSFPFGYDGQSVTIIVVFFAVVGLLTVLQKTWGWWLAILVLCLLTFFPPFYLLGVKYLGFNISRGSPLGHIMLPLTIITAFSIDALAKRPRQKMGYAKVVFFGWLATLLVIGIGIGYGFYQQKTIVWGQGVGMLLISGLLIAQYIKHRPLLLMIALALVLLINSYPLMLKQPPDQISITSPLVEKVRGNLPQGSYYAVASPGLSVLPPNLNVIVGLSSIHSYNSLSSTRYHTLIKVLGGGVQTFGRLNVSISPDYSSPMLWMSNISLILSKGELAHDNLEFLGQESGINLDRVASRMGESLQVSAPEFEIDASKMVINDPRLLKWSSPIKMLDEGDVLEFEVSPSPPSVFLLSQKFHRDWQARTYTDGGWRPAPTVEINGVFQGVLLPSESSRVRLEFKPFVRFAWIAHVFWVLLLILVGFKSWWRYRRRVLEKA